MKRRRQIVATCLAGVFVAATAVSSYAQEPAEGDQSDLIKALLDDVKNAKGDKPASRPGMPELVTDCPGADVFGGTDIEKAGWCRVDRGPPYAALRKLATEAVKANERSFRAHYLMGLAQHMGEANLPKALYHLHRAETLYIKDYGEVPSSREAPGVRAYTRTLLELIYVHGEMDHHEEKIRYVDAMATRLGMNYAPLKAWPLLKLKRFEDARKIAEDALADTERAPYWRPIALTAMCAIESEMRNRQKAYEACTAAAKPVMNSRTEGGVAMSNAAASAMEVFRFAEAERYYVEATRRPVEGTINPWGRLTLLYLQQGRFAEAVSAIKQMHTYRRSRPVYFLQQDQADAELTVASVLLVGGRADKAAELTGNIVDQPDRQGTSSASSDQNEAGNLILDRVVRLDLARRLEEEASWSKFTDSVKLRARAVRLRFEAWLRTRKAAKILANHERLVTTLRPECPGSVEMPAWLDPEVVRVVGPGVAIAAIAEARADETLPKVYADPVFNTFLAEAYLMQGNEDEALEAAHKAVEGLPATQALVRARAAAVGAEAAESLGKVAEAVALWEKVLTNDPGLVRRLGQSLPVAFAPLGNEPEIFEAIDELRGSPLFEEEDWGFRLAVGKDVLVLGLPDGSELLRATVRAAQKDEEDPGLATRIAETAHKSLLLPAVDVAQVDVRSLDGGLTGGSAAEQTDSIIKQFLDPTKK